MAETQRTKDGFVNASTGIWKNNTAGDISPQDLRDALESLDLSCGSMYVSTPAATTISTVSTWTKVAGTTTSGILNRFDMPANNRLRYTGSPDVRLIGQISVSFAPAAASKTLELAAYHYDDSGASGSIITASKQRIAWPASTDIMHATVLVEVANMSQNDYIELHVQNTTDSENATVTYMHAMFVGMFK